MKKIIALTIAAIIGLSATNSFAGVNSHQKHQKERIYNGVKTGQLTYKETKKLTKQQKKIAQTEKHMRKDGKLDAKERAKLAHMQSHASKNIYAKKHNDRSR